VDPIRLHIGKDSPKPPEAWWTKLGREVLVKKLKHPLMVVLMLLIAVCFSGLIAVKGIVPVALIVILSVALPVIYGIIVYPQFGIIVMMVAAYFIMWVMRIGVNFPLGTLMDGMQALLIFGFLLKIKQRKDWKVFNNPISILVLIWICYNLLEVANPAASSRLAWLYTLRSVAILMLMYFIFYYNIRTVQFIRLILKVWIVLSTFAALYGFYQEAFGYLGFEQRWINSDPLITDLYFIAGHWRKFAIFSDPVAFAYNMVASSILCFCISTAPIASWKKITLIVLGVLHIMSMLYSGTRGAYVLLPVAMLMYCVLKFNKRILIFAIAGGLAIAAIIVVPTGNPTIVRFQSAFKPSDDASFNVRTINQRKIQPYILTHPMGGGLGATGVWGQRFSPGSYLASFPPDSGYVRVAVELGWLGLFIFCLLMFTILKTGINNYYRIRNKELKAYCLAMLLIVFALNIGNYPQEALVQFPTNIYFYLVTALINVLLTIDQQENGASPATA
jgi:putative inorganic carbon (hco3(-)) transporter